MLKTCHDFDILQWLVDKDFKRLHSFGKLSHFTAENKPEGAPARCIDGCPHGDTCFYNTKKLYIDKETATPWFRNAATAAPLGTVAQDEEVIEALKTTDYGRCVYDMDNDVMDHQTVNIEFDDDIITTFTMSAFNEGGRKITIMGTEGELIGAAGTGDIEIFSFRDRQKTVIKTSDIIQDETQAGGHGGGDMRLIKALVELIGDGQTSVSYCSATTSAKNHLAVFAAEESRHNSTVVDFDEYLKKYDL